MMGAGAPMYSLRPVTGRPMMIAPVTRPAPTVRPPCGSRNAGNFRSMQLCFTPDVVCHRHASAGGNLLQCRVVMGLR